MRTLLVLSVIGFVTFLGWQAYLDSEKGSVSKLSQIEENSRSEIPSRPVIASKQEPSAEFHNDHSVPQKFTPKRTVRKSVNTGLKQQQIKQAFLPTNAEIHPDLPSKKNPRSYDQFVKIEKQWATPAEGRVTDILVAKHQPCVGYSVFCERVRTGNDVQVVGLSIDASRVADKRQRVIQGDLHKGHYVENTPALYID